MKVPDTRNIPHNSVHCLAYLTTIPCNMNKSLVQIGCIYFLTFMVNNTCTHLMMFSFIPFQTLYVDIHFFFCISSLISPTSVSSEYKIISISPRRYMAEILQIRRKTLCNQSFDESNLLF